MNTVSNLLSEVDEYKFKAYQHAITILKSIQIRTQYKTLHFNFVN